MAPSGLEWRLVGDERLVDVDADPDGAFEIYNKCLDCCPVLGCDTCGSCEDHPVTDGGIVERMPTREEETRVF